MRSGAATGHTGYFHEAALYESDAELLEIVVPFLLDGIAAGEPTMVALDARNSAIIAGADADLSDVAFMPASELYRRPAATIRAFRELFQDSVDEGASQIRAVGDVPHPGVGTAWDDWGRYEAAINHAFDDLPVWGLCTYDTRITPPEVLADVARTHPHLAFPGGTHQRNTQFEDPATFARGQASFVPPTPPTTPAVVLVDPSPPAARAAVDELCATLSLTVLQRDDLRLAVTEAVANAHHHGHEPVQLTAWADQEHLTVTVRDAGTGPVDPFVGLLGPQMSSPSGRGLWIMHQLSVEVTMHFERDAFTIAIVAALHVR